MAVIIWALSIVCVVLTAAVLILLLKDAQTAKIVHPLPDVPARTDLWAEVIEKAPIGVLVFNASLSLAAANPAARQLLQLTDGSLPVSVKPAVLVSLARRALRTGEEVRSEIDRWPDRQRVLAVAIPTAEDQVIVFLDDVSAAAEVNQMRRQFVVNASHELKSPAAAIHALAETVSQAVDEDPQAARRFSRKLLLESERLSRLIQDLLDLSRLEDPAHFSDALVDLGAITEREAEGLRRLADERSIDLKVDVTAGAVVRGDEQQVGLLARNLIDNAIRYTPMDGRVTVNVERNETEAVLEVEDTGAGIPLNAQSRVFERFFRVDEDRGRASGGTGLGLAIVKHVAEMHGGHVSLRSELGEGSTFRVRLPLLSGDGS